MDIIITKKVQSITNKSFSRKSPKKLYAYIFKNIFRAFFFFYNNIIGGEYMNSSILLLQEKFKKIKAEGWCESLSGGNGNVGMTFEKKIGIEPNQFSIPDFEGIEIKTKLDGTKPLITLFSATFDGTYLFEMKRIAETYGEFDSTFKSAKFFYCSVDAKNYTYLANGIKLKLEVSYSEKRIYLAVYDKNNILIDHESFWSFELLQEKLEHKLNYLAFISAKKMVKNGKIFFYYYDIQFMKLRNFYTFLKLVEIGKIDVCFKYGVYRSGVRIGKPCDHGTSFNINRYDLNKLFLELET